MPTVDLVSESKVNGEEIEIIEPLSIFVVESVTEGEDDTAPLSAPPAEHLVPMDTSEDSESELELLKKLDRIDLS
jgi:hypothetical protein